MTSLFGFIIECETEDILHISFTLLRTESDLLTSGNDQSKVLKYSESLSVRGLSFVLNWINGISRIYWRIWAILFGFSMNHQVWLPIQSSADLSASTSGFVFLPHWKVNYYIRLDRSHVRSQRLTVSHFGQRLGRFRTSISYINVSLYRSLQFIKKSCSSIILVDRAFCFSSSFKASPKVRYKSTLPPET